VLNVAKSELSQVIGPAGARDQAGLSRKLDRAAEDGEPFGLLLGDYEFSQDPGDLAVLEAIAHLADAAHAPFLPAVAPAFFGLREFTDLDDLPDLVARIGSAEDDRWNAFRASDSSRSVGLCLPRILVRLPYGRDTRSVESFPFEEDIQAAGL